MELQEFMKEFERMCWFYKSNNKSNNEFPMGCPMIGVNISQCRKVTFERPSEVEKIVSDWIKSHPKLPAWREWLGSHGITVRCDGSLQFNTEFDVDKPVPEGFWKE